MTMLLHSSNETAYCPIQPITKWALCNSFGKQVINYIGPVWTDRSKHPLA